MAGMFKPTPSLNSRLEARLRGWRGPAVGILRKESKRTDPLALDPPFLSAPHHEPQTALPTETAYKMMGLPMQDILDMRGGTRRPVERDDLLQWRRALGQAAPEKGELELNVARVAQKSRSQGPYRRRVGNAEMTAIPKVNAARYKPPATNYWRHSIYAYNKETTKNLPATTLNANRLIRAYFNMVPKDGSEQEDTAALASALAEGEDPTAETDAKPTEGESAAPTDARAAQEKANRIKFKEHKTNENRIYISDRGYINKGMIRQDVLGKISRRMQPKTAFHYPYRDVQAASAQITFKHWRDGVGVSVHVHEGVPEAKGPPRMRN